MKMTKKEIEEQFFLRPEHLASNEPLPEIPYLTDEVILGEEEKQPERPGDDEHFHSWEQYT
jgi:hypothetical protein